MGIRYYAYPVHSDDIARARADPLAFVSDDPFSDAWGPEELRPTMLYLDKCWHYLQVVLRPRSDGAPRTSFGLVEGQVTHTDRGWIPFVKLLAPDDVAAIADDLALVDGDDVRIALGLDLTEIDEPSQLVEYDYVLQYLADARAFLAELVKHRQGMVYMIG